MWPRWDTKRYRQITGWLRSSTSPDFFALASMEARANQSSIKLVLFLHEFSQNFAAGAHAILGQGRQRIIDHVEP
jgi:hypothetical protein